MLLPEPMPPVRSQTRGFDTRPTVASHPMEEVMGWQRRMMRIITFIEWSALVVAIILAITLK